MSKAVFLDRDGTLVRVYAGRPANTVDELELLNNVVPSLAMLSEAGFLLVVVTNQGGIGMGYMTNEVMERMNERLSDLLIVGGAQGIDATYWCPHKPNAGCECRKPKPGMIMWAAEDLGIDLSRSYMVGDDVNDMRAGKAAGLRYLVQVVSNRYSGNDVADLVAMDMVAAARAIVYVERNPR